MTGQRLLHYKIVEKLGEGGMGVVYKALDTHLDRLVALKVLPPEKVADPERKRRFVREAKAASALNHPNIITIHDIAEAVPSGPLQDTTVDFIVMEYVDGRSLDGLMAGGPLRVEEALGYAVQIAAALAAAHTAGIVHRDIKPANIMVAGEPSVPGQIKVLDFGLAKLSERVATEPDASTRTIGIRTEQGAILGTVAYMSPEQAEGKAVDARTDVFSFGCVLYEMLTRQRPFQGDSNLSILTGILHRQPTPLKKLRPDTPAQLQAIISRSLEKDRDRRYPSATELWKDLVACRSRLAATGLGSLLRKPQVAIPALLLLVAVLAAGTWFGMRSRRASWARNVALPEIARLVQQRETAVQAFHLALQAQRFLPEDHPGLQQLWRDVTAPITIRTTPPGAAIDWKDYSATDDSPWEPLGSSPIEGRRVPNGYLRWRISKEGFDTVELAFSSWNTSVVQFQLDPQGSTPPGMVRVPGGAHQFGAAPPVELQDYWLDKYEVTNQQFKEFVDAGGYRKREYWKYQFVKDGRELSWERAMEEFRDATGRPGPSTWELGAYADGQADFPVGGVSWFEADAYATFKGKSLPTVYHWHKAADVGIFSDIHRLSNFGTGPARVGSHRGLSPYGAYDMAGNVKEWCWNQSGDRRYILGGAWGEPSYMFADPDAQPPFQRLATYGFRCAKYVRPVSDSLTAPVSELSRDFSKEKPASDETFRLYQNVYSYDRIPLNAVVESVDETPAHWRTEKISFQAAYGNERVTAYVFLPRNAVPPYQTVVHFPGGYAVRSRSSENLSMQFVDFIIRSGRAVLYPIYKGLCAGI
jgi:eukaryotic-like serine/threonine-protein kinase